MRCKFWCFKGSKSRKPHFLSQMMQAGRRAAPAAAGVADGGRHQQRPDARHADGTGGDARLPRRGAPEGGTLHTCSIAAHQRSRLNVHQPATQRHSCRNRTMGRSGRRRRALRKRSNFIAACQVSFPHRFQYLAQLLEEKRKAKEDDVARREEERALRDSLAGGGADRGRPMLPPDLLVGITHSTHRPHSSSLCLNTGQASASMRALRRRCWTASGS